jgi:urease accessory protein UreH
MIQRLRVGDQSRLDYLAKAIVPCSGCRFSQSLKIDVKKTSDVVIVDAWTLGRLASGEVGRFEQLDNDVEFFFESRLVWKEAWHLNPLHPEGLAILGGNRMWATILSVGDAAHERSRGWITRWEARGGWGSWGELVPGVQMARLFSAEWIDPLDGWED